MGIRFTCPNGHKLHVKTFLAGKRGVCPQCGAKILIPPEDQPPQQVPLASAELQRAGPAESTVALAGAFTEAGSPSIVIAVADSSFANAPSADAPAAAPPSTVAASPPAIPIASTIAPIVSQAPAAAQPLIVPDAVESVSPAVRYVARRERNRRNQLVFAAMLLLAVIVLAGVLVFVLQRGAGSAPATNVQPVSFEECASSRPVAV